MTVRCNILDVLRVFPRYTGDRSQKWKKTGIHTYTNAHLCSQRTKDRLRHWIGILDEAVKKEGLRYPVRMVDVTGDDLVLMHCSVYFKKLWSYARRAFVWQYRKRDLPIVVRMGGMLYVWNGTHRTTVCRLANRPLRAKLIDVDAYQKWKQACRKVKRK